MNKLVALCAFVAAASFARADVAEFSLFAPAQTAPVDTDIGGLRLDLVYGANRNMYGLDLGVAGKTSGDVMGVQVVVGVNRVEGDAYGIQAALCMNSVLKDAYGVQWGYGVNHTVGNFSGYQCGVYNRVNGTMRGLEYGVVSYSTDLRGAQAGIVNVGTSATGLQVGVVNWADRMQGIQIGILNFIPSSPLPFFPILNCYF